MIARTKSLAGAVAIIATASMAGAATQSVTFNTLNGSTSLATPFNVGDVLIVDTLVTSGPGPLSQSVTFITAGAVGSFSGEAVWEISTATSTLPRLTGVNIDIFDASNALVNSDTFIGTLGGFAHSTLGSALPPGTYHMVATGTAVRDAVLDISLTFAPVPEPTSLLALSSFAFLAKRRRA